MVLHHDPTPTHTRHPTFALPACRRNQRLLHASLDSRLRRLDQADLMTTDEAAALLGASRLTVNAWINKGRCIGLTRTKRGFKVPSWQFEPTIWDLLPVIGGSHLNRDRGAAPR